MPTQSGSTGPESGRLSPEHNPQSDDAPVPCPFIYAKGKRCTGHIVRIEAFKADLSWSWSSDGKWSLSVGEPRSHYHLYCSEKNTHAGAGRPDGLRFYYRDLPPALRKAIAEAGQ